MKIYMEHGNNKVTLETNSETIDEILEDIVRVLISMSFYPETVYQGIIDLATEIEENKKESE